MSAKRTFNKWIKNRTESQLEIVDEICNELNINADDWFKYIFLKEDTSYHSGTDFLDEILPAFLMYIGHNFNRLFNDYLPAKGTNIRGEIYHDIYLCLNYKPSKHLYLDDEDKVEVENIIRTLTLEQRSDLLKNNTFKYISNKTKLKIFSTKELRAIKLKNINEYS